MGLEINITALNGHLNNYDTNGDGILDEQEGIAMDETMSQVNDITRGARARQASPSPFCQQNQEAEAGIDTIQKALVDANILQQAGLDLYRDIQNGGATGILRSYSAFENAVKNSPEYAALGENPNPREVRCLIEQSYRTATASPDCPGGRDLVADIRANQAPNSFVRMFDNMFRFEENHIETADNILQQTLYKNE